MGKLAVLCDQVGVLGGAERYWETVLPGLADMGVRLRVFARRAGGSPPFDAGVHTVSWADEDGAPNARAAADIAAALRAEPPDAVITANVFDPAVLEVVREYAPRWVLRVHDHRAFCPTGDRVFPQFEDECHSPMGSACRVATLLRGCVRGPRPSSFRRIAARERVRDLFARADRVIVSTEHMRATCLCNGIPADRLEIMPPPLPDEAYAAVPAARPATPTILFASRLTARKGLRSLRAALAILPARERPRLVVAGEGEAEERDAVAAAMRDGTGSEWRGRLTAAQLRAAIDDADAVAVPSLWPEPFGLIGIEAQARGRPAVAYSTGGIAEWIGGAGLTVRRGDETALAAAIRRILSEPTWKRLAAAARSHAERYRVGPHLDRLFQVCFAGFDHR